MTETTQTASCTCGAVGITVQGTPAFSAICCCADCQARTGSAFGLSAYFQADQVVARYGTPTTYRRMSDKNRWLDFRFCPECGTNVWWEAEFLPGKVGIAAPLLDLKEFSPDGAYFCATKPEFVHFDTAIPTGMGPTTGS